VLEKAASSSDRIRRAAVLALGDLADPKAEAVLLERIREDEDEATVRFAAGAASVFSDPDVRDVLLATLDRPGIEDATRAVVLRALGAQPPSEEIENRLLRAARGADVRGTKVDPVVRAAALASLRSYDGPAVVKTLVALLPDEDPATRSSVVALLARLGHDEKGFLRLLERFLGSEDRSVVETSALALARLRGAEAKPALARIRETHRAYPFVRNVLAGLEREDADAYFRAWIDEWVEWLGGTSEALRRNLSNAQLFELFELDRRLIKGAKPGDTRPRIGKALSTAQQDLRLWFEYEPYFDPVP